MTVVNERQRTGEGRRAIVRALPEAAGMANRSKEKEGCVCVCVWGGGVSVRGGSFLSSRVCPCSSSWLVATPRGPLVVPRKSRHRRPPKVTPTQNTEQNKAVGSETQAQARSPVACKDHRAIEGCVV
jgi:hypothetical protein